MSDQDPQETAYRDTLYAHANQADDSAAACVICGDKAVDGIMCDDPVCALEHNREEALMELVWLESQTH